MFFSQGVLTSEEEGAAKATCGTCSVIDECLAYAIAHAVRYGVWGGLTSEERRPIRRAWLAQRAYVVNPAS
jgi:WhiB family redox-sensing transcriptional regulator